MPRKGSKCQTSPRPKRCLDNALRIGSELHLACAQLGPVLKPRRGPYVQAMRSQETILGSSTIGLPSESRVRAATSAVQDFTCHSPYTCSTSFNIVVALALMKYIILKIKSRAIASYKNR